MLPVGEEEATFYFAKEASDRFRVVLVPEQTLSMTNYIRTNATAKGRGAVSTIINDSLFSCKDIVAIGDPRCIRSPIYFVDYFKNKDLGHVVRKQYASEHQVAGEHKDDAAKAFLSYPSTLLLGWSL